MNKLIILFSLLSLIACKDFVPEFYGNIKDKDREITVTFNKPDSCYFGDTLKIAINTNFDEFITEVELKRELYSNLETLDLDISYPYNLTWITSNFENYSYPKI